MSDDSWRPERREQRLQDILAHGDAILEMTQGRSRDDVAADAMRLKAIIYDFQCISEDAGRLLRIDPDLAERHPGIPWTQVRSMGNVIRHAYGVVDLDTLWATATSGKLQRLLEVVRQELER